MKINVCQAADTVSGLTTWWQNLSLRVASGRRMGIACCALLCLFFVPQIILAASTVQVAQVIDGDTLRLTDGRSLRLAGIDTPELGHGKGKDQYYAREAAATLRGLVSQGKLTLHPVAGGEKDRHKRVLAEALLPDGTSLNEMMVAEGAALAYWHKGFDQKFWQRLLTAQQTAMEHKRGMWGRILKDKVNSQRYVGNRNSQRLFPQSCQDVDKIKPSNRVHFSSLEEALNQGFAPARECVFWPES